MQSLVWTKAEWMEIQEVAIPVINEEEVLVKVDAVGICGSEIEGYLGHNSLRVPPLIMGHEFSGTIHDLGAKVNGLTRGQKVVVNPLLSCRKCISCRKGSVHLCVNRTIIGIHRPGAFAEYVNVPSSAVHVIPETMNSFRAALVEPLACSLRATRRAMEKHPFANVVVFGAGTIGLLSFLTAQILGASRVIVVDTNESRLKTPQRLGATGTISPREHGYIQRIKKVMGPLGIDVVIDAAGFQPTRSAAIELINPGGTVMNIGLGIDKTEVPINVCIRNEINLLGSFSYQDQDFDYAVELLKSGKIDHAEWSEIRPLKDGNQAFQDLVQGKVENAKIFLAL
ncbi:alcohol dehydrogenase catalytic domain-containing protein [Paenibacillus alginolyticus]|uniref:alcohol dehydrogenase catalytic domain-containing protein n=1 Tax=Paenibacillus alginolyticus TaxID=59839 RepID=UPI000401AE18|nr:alcohol dehydrogenase catalytic domain-containing protein [Paenibacillus alginolyticus]MCY9667815.1 alcohol dehydrogenase catalytic domain-containing protein [Paenibacillus alginolyticus]